MDNIIFGVPTLIEYVTNASKPCTVYSEHVINYDNRKIPFEYNNTERWNRVTEDDDKKFAVYVEKFKDQKLATRVLIGEHEMHIIPENESV